MLKQQNDKGPPGAWAPGPRLKQREFELFRRMIASICGIKLSDAKWMLVQNRLGKRLRALGIDSFSEYHRLLCSPEGRQSELGDFLSAITTNETHFFREPHHFEILKKKILPELAAIRPKKATFRIWSAGCSTGQEVYTLAMVLDEWTKGATLRSYSIIGSDIDSRVLQVAQSGEYSSALRSEIPARHQLRNIDKSRDVLRIKAALKKRVKFRHHNFAELAPQRPRLDVIFCRNAVMYLDKDTRWHLAQVFRDSLLDGGYLILGSSESLHGMPQIFETERIDRTLVYKKRSGLGEAQ